MRRLALALSLLACAAQAWAGPISSATISSSGNQADYGYDVAVNTTTGHVYVTGQIMGPTANADLWIGKYDSNLVLLASAAVNGSLDRSDSGRGVALDGAGNVYIGGQVNALNDNDSGVLWALKFDPNLVFLASATYNHTSPFEDGGTGVALDGSGNVYVSGTFRTPGGGHEQGVVKFTSALAFLGSANSGGGLDWGGQGIAVSPGGDSYTAGEGNGSIRLMRCNSTPGLVSNTSVAGSGASGVAYDATSNKVYFVGSKLNSNNDAWVSKYDAAMSFLSSGTFDGAAALPDSALAAALFGSNLYFVGVSSGGASGYDAWITLLDQNLVQLASTTFNGTDNLPDSANGVALDVSGNVYVAGTVGRAAGGSDIWVAKFASLSPPPTLVGPANGAYISTTTPTLVWAGLSGSTFTAQIATDSGFSTIVVDSTTRNTFLISTTPLVAGSTYWWRVRDVESGGLSPAASFVIDGASPSYSGPQVSTAGTGPWTSLPMTTYLSSNVVTARITVQDSLSGLLVSSGPPSGLVGQWHFDESSGTTALDAAGISAPGVFSGAGPSWGAGKQGGAVDLTLNNSFIQVPHIAAQNTSELTIEMWIKPSLPDFNLTGADPFMALIAKRTANSQTPYVFGIRAGGTLSLNWWDSVSGFPSPSSPPIVKVNAWQHIAVTRTGSPGSYQTTFYYNGAPFSTSVDAAPGSPLTSTQDLLIGKDSYFQGQTTQGTYRGLIDGVRVFSVARSSAQILADYQSDTLGAHNRGKAFAAQYSTDGGLAWNFVSTNSLTLTGADGTTGAQTLTAANIPLVTSTAALAPTNLIRFIASDMAGSVGTTTYAVLVDTTSLAPPGCGITANVRKNGFNAFTTISAAVASLPQALTENSCVVVRDTQTYSEQVAIEGFANNGFQLKIMSDPSFVSSAPVVSPPGAMTAGFLIKNASVTLQGFTVRPNASVSYGVQASSAYVTISSVNVDAGGFVSVAGIALSSWSALSYSSVTVQGTAHGIYLEGSAMTTVSYSTAHLTGGAFHALYLNGASSNTITRSFLRTLGTGDAARLSAGANGNTISQSTMTRLNGGFSGMGLWITNASSNAIVQSYIYNLGDHGARVDGTDSSYNQISQSTMVSENSGRAALSLYQSSRTQVSLSLMRNPAGHAADLDSTTRNTISQSTMTSSAALTVYALHLVNADSNTVTGSYIQNLPGTAVRLDPGSDFNTVSLSTVVSNDANYFAFYFNGADGNTATGLDIRNTAGNGVTVFNGSDNNTISFSTVVSNKLDGNGLYFSGSDSNTVTGSYVQHLQGWGAFLDTGSDYNTISLSTMISNSGSRNALNLVAASGNTISQSYVSNTNGTAAKLEGGSALNTLSQSTFTSVSPGGMGLRFVTASSNTLTQSVVFSLTSFGARFTAGSNYNLVAENRITSFGTGLSAFSLNASSFNTITQSLFSGTPASGISLDNGANRNTISFSTITGNSGFHALNLNDVSSTTISNCYVQDSTAVFVSGSSNTYVIDSAIEGVGGRGIWVLNGGSGLSVTSSAFTGSTGDAAIYLDDGGGGAVSIGSVTVTGAWRGLVLSTQAPGFVLAVDSITFSGLSAGATAIHFLGGLVSSTITLANFADASVGVNVSAAALNPASIIRMRYHSGTRNGPIYENDPSGVVHWQAGSYPGCAATANVGPGQDFVTISSGVAGLPGTLTGHSCVVLRHGGAYNEQVTVEGFVNNGSSITIILDPALSTTARVNPPFFSQAAFVVKNASVNIVGIQVTPTNSITYGIFVSSPQVTISSVVIADSFSQISAAGIALSSWTTVSYTSVTVGSVGAYGFLLQGSTMSSVSFSTVTNNGAGQAAIYLGGASSNTFTRVLAHNSAGGGGIQINGGGYNNVNLSSASSTGSSGMFINLSSFNAVSASYMGSSGTGYGLRLQDSRFNTVSQSTAVAVMAGMSALQLSFSSSNTFTGVFASHTQGYGAYFSDSSSNTVSFSTFTGGSPTEYGLYLFNSSSNSFAGSYFSNPAGPAAVFMNASSNTVSQGVFAGSAANYSLQLNNADGNRIEDSRALTGAHLTNTSDNNIISGSTFTQNSITLHGLFLQEASSNTVSFSFMANPSGEALHIGGPGNNNYNAVSQSTITSETGGSALYLSGTGNAFVSNYIGNAGGYGAQLQNASFTSILQSTITNNFAASAALHLSNSSSNTVSRSVVVNNAGPGVELQTASNWNVVRESVVRGGDSGIKVPTPLEGLSVVLSTVTGAGASGAGLWVNSVSSYVSVSHSYVQGSTGVYLSGASRTSVNSSVIAGETAVAMGVGLYLTNSGQHLAMSSNTVLGGGLGGIAVDNNSSGSITLSTNTVITRGASHGVVASDLNPAAVVWITSNTILPSLSASATTFGVFLNNLPGGATIQNNGIYYRTAGAAFGGLGAGAYGIYAKASSGIKIDRNRISNPSMVTAGNYVGVALSGLTGAIVKFNDLYSTGAGLTTFNLLRVDGSPNAVVRNNILSSSMTATTNRLIVVDGASQTGFSSDFNTFFSSNAAYSGTWGAGTVSLLLNWRTTTGQDANTLPDNPLWLDPAGEDFHPLSRGGRWNGVAFVNDAVSGPGLDRADSAEPILLESAPNGARANQGSYGQTAEASRSVLPCPTTRFVRQGGGGDDTTIQNAVNALGNPLPNHSCIVIGDTGFYNEQVTVQGFINNGSSITIMADPALGGRPTVRSGFVIRNASVNVAGVLVEPLAFINYGIQASSANITITSVTVTDPGAGGFNFAAVTLSSFSSLSYAVITADGGDGVHLEGASSLVAYSTITSNAAGVRALFINGVDSNTVTASYISNPAGGGARLAAGSEYNTISQSTIANNVGIDNALTLAGADFNTVTGSFISNPAGYAATLESGSDRNTISLSTFAAGGAGASALYLTNSDSNTVTGSYLSNPVGAGVRVNVGADYNSVSQSTMTSGSAGNAALDFSGGSFNTVTGSLVSNPAGYGARMTGGSSRNTISFSTMTSGAIGYMALYITASASNTVSDSLVSNPGGVAAALESGAAYNAISRSTITSDEGGSRALTIMGSDFNSLVDSFVSNPSGGGARIYGGADFTSILRSTVASAGTGFPALMIADASSGTVVSSYIQGSTAAIVSGSTGTIINASVLVATNTTGVALTLQGGSRHLTLSSNTFIAGTSGGGVFIDSGNAGAIMLSTNTLVGGRSAFSAFGQQSGTTLWITSNTILPSISPSFIAYGIYMDGLVTGATIQNNAIVYRVPGNNIAGSFYTAAIEAKNSVGLMIIGNRLSNPGMVDGKALGVGLTDTPNTVFKYNDVHSTGTSIASAYHMRLTNSPGAQLHNNVFSSSWSVVTSTGSLYVDTASQTGFVSDYNAFFSSNAFNSIEWGNGPTQGLSFPWSSTTGRDVNSISRHPRWKDVSPGVEDFHHLSQAGRWNGTAFVNDGYTSDLLDKGDPAGAFSNEAAPNGGRANLGSYGNTAEASKTPPPPSAPAVAAVFTSSIAVSYTLAGSDGYVIGASTAADMSGTLFSSVTANGALALLAPQGLAANTTYYLQTAATWGDFVSVSGVLLATATLANPPAPATPAFFDVNPTFLSVSWDINGNFIDVTTYTIVFTTGAVFPNSFAGNVPSWKLAAGPVPNESAANLAKNTTYYAFAAAQNWNGVPSAYAALGSTSTLADVPLTAVSTFSGVGSSSFTVSWNANGNPLSVTTYTVTVSTAGDFNDFASSVTFSTVPAFGPSATFTGLSAYTTYFFRLRAVNANGVPSAYAVLGSTQTRPVTLQAPAIAGVTSVSSHSITATWGLSALATGYTLVASLTNDPAAVFASSAPVGIDATTATVFTPSLNANTTYYLFVRATGPGAATAFSAFPATSTLTGDPATAVSTFSAVLLTSMTVSWLPGGNPVGVTTYTVVLSTGVPYPNTYAGNQTLSTAPAGAALAASFTGLDDNTAYFLYAAAVNHNGVQGAFVALGSTVTKISAPATVLFDEISSNTIVASAYAPTPLFSNLGTGLSGTRIARNGAYQGFHGEAWAAATALPAPLRDAAAAGYAAKVYVSGGFNGGTAQSAARVYDPATGAWTALAGLPAARGGHAAATIRGRIYAVGGTFDGFTSLNSNAEYDPATDAWTAKAALPDRSDHLSAVAVGDALFAFGGVTDGVDNVKNVSYDPSSNAWASKVDFPAARHQTAAATTAGPAGGTIIAAGGSGPASGVFAYDAALNAWTGKAAMPAAVAEAGAASLGGKIFVIGGAGVVKTVYEYDPASNAWAARADMTTARAGLSVVAAGGRLYALGGTVDGGATSLTVNEEYDPGLATKFTGLTPNTQAGFKAQARNQAGTLSAETVVIATWTWAAPPAAVAAPFAVVETDSVTFSWALNGNPGSTEFKARASTAAAFGGGAAVLSSDWDAMTSTATLGLSPNTTYFFQSAARNGVGGVPGIMTAWVPLGSTATLAMVPAAAPTPFPAADTNGLTVSWLPNGNPLTITTYTVVLSTSVAYPNANAGNVMIASTFPAGALPTASLAGLLANTTYFAFASAVNHNGLRTAYAALGSTSTLALPPAAASPVFSAVGESSATFSWLPNGNPVGVTTYSVVLSTGGAINSFAGNVVFSTAPAGALPTGTAPAGLAPNTTYFAYAAAVNGNGAVSAYTLLGSTATMAVLPGTAVTTFSAVHISSLSVSWSAAGNPLSITTYTVQLSTAADFNAFASSVVFSTAPASGPSATFTGLTDFTQYFFRVRAVNHGGAATPFVALGSTTTLIAPLDPPALAGFASVDITSITGSWGLVAAATGYTFVASLSPADPPTVVAASSTTLSNAAITAAAFAPPLTPNTTYFLFVRANGPLRSSPYAAYGATSTLTAPPATAVSTFTGVGITSFTVSWDANGNALAITTYTVQLSTAPDFNAFATSVTFTTAPVFGPNAMLTGLSGNTSYYLRVRSLNHNGVPSAYVSLGSTLTVASPLFPTILDSQGGDAVWRRSNSALYQVAFLDTSGAHLDRFQVKASTTAGGLGTDIAPYTDVIVGLSPADDYNTPWALPASVFNALLEGVTNYVTVRVFNGPPLNNSTVLQDAFYVQKDTTSPVMVDAQAGDAVPRSAPGTTYAVGVRDPSSGLAAFQYSASLAPGTADASLIGWTDIAVVAGTTYYDTPWPVDFAQLVSGVTNYISVRSWDVAGSTTTAPDAFFVHKDTTGPSVAIAAPQAGFNSALATLSGTAASLYGVQGTEVSLLDVLSNLYWNPGSAAFNSAAPIMIAASGTTAWTLSPGITWVDGASYRAVARSSTTAGLYSTTYATTTFIMDLSKPTVAVTAPVPDSTVAVLPLLSGTAADPAPNPSGLSSVELRLRRNADGFWWNWFTQSWGATAVSSVTAGTTAWSLTPTPELKASLASGASYFIAVRASDNAFPANQGDFFVSGATFTWQDVTPPAAVADLAGAHVATPGSINLTWTAAGDDGSVGRIETGEYRIFYSTDIAAVPSTATAQVVIATAGVNPGDLQSYTLAGLNPGVTYYLSLALADSDVNWSSFSNQASTSASPSPLNAITGHVVDVSTLGITAVQVECWNAADALVGTTFTLADGSGTYTVNGLPPGSYKLRVTWTVNGFSTSLWQDGIAMGSTNVDFFLNINYALATLTGTLSTLTTSSFGGGGLSAASAVESFIELHQNGRQVARTTVQPTGRWAIPGLLPGSYSVRAFTGLGYTPFQDVVLAEGEVRVLGFVFDPLPEASVFAFPNPARAATTIRFESALSPIEAGIYIFDLRGNLVKEIPDSQISRAAAPVYRAAWDLSSSAGRSVAPGVYHVMVKIKGGDGQSAKVVKKLAVVR